MQLTWATMTPGLRCLIGLSCLSQCTVVSGSGIVDTVVFLVYIDFNCWSQNKPGDQTFIWRHIINLTSWRLCSQCHTFHKCFTSSLISKLHSNLCGYGAGRSPTPLWNESTSSVTPGLLWFLHYILVKALEHWVQMNLDTRLHTHTHTHVIQCPTTWSWCFSSTSGNSPYDSVLVIVPQTTVQSFQGCFKQICLMVWCTILLYTVIQIFSLTLMDNFTTI